MKLSFPYINYPSLIKPDICNKIIDLGISKIERNKKEGLNTTGKTFYDKQKSKINFERSRVLKDNSTSDKTIEELKNINGMTIPMLALLAKENILTLNDFAELAAFELIDKEEGILRSLDIEEELANNMIMEARKNWFD